MKQWWLSRTPQDKLALIVTAAAVTVLLLYLLIWLPFEKSVDKKADLVESQRATLLWMRESAAEINLLKERAKVNRRSGSNEALLTLVDRTAKKNQLRQFIQRLKPDGARTVQIWVEQAPFDSLIQWLGILVNQYGILLESVSIERQDKPGIINAKLNLQRVTP
ncbi:MAG: type II secretion system protein M [Gammaproteobacteria bacterium]|nr:type II secretion system protein M [Gammaproteobacteria bacterium]